MENFKLEYIYNYGSYVTPEDIKVSIFAKMFPSLYFYYRIMTLILHGSNLAVKGEYDLHQWMVSSFRALDIIEKCGIKVRIDGVDNIKKTEGPVVFVANHMSTAETFLLPSIIVPFKPVTYVLKEGLMKVPFFKNILKARDPIVVTRDNPKEDFRIVMEKGIKHLKNGMSIIVFPQKTRTTSFYEKQFNSMGIKLAKKANVPVIPIALKTDAWSNGKFIKDLGKIYTDRDMRFVIGNPIEIKGKGDEEHQMVIDFIKKHLSEWGVVVER
ncbi:MAG: 1-acyl-sn-glycerol-3-phosphate acyltransferase [Calditerrivibrio sp.]|nr:1-acyl-sn-glycerol-3-phosphate acyltransferase [Calditerrivibrio sp.]